MNSDAMLVPTVLFWILVSLIAVLPIRWSVIFFLLLVQIDLSALGNFSTTSVGVDNAVKIVIVPAFLLFRVRKSIHINEEARKLIFYWILLVSYACLAILWTPFRVPAIKMAGYLYAYSALFLVFSVAWRNNWFTTRTLMFLVWVSLAGAVIQSYFLGNAFGSDEFEWRFTTFTGAQSFAPFMLCLLVLLLFRRGVSFSIVVTAIAASLGMLMTGSRSIFLGFFAVLVMYGIFLTIGSGRTIRFGVLFKRLLLIGVGMAIVLAIVVELLPENRLNEMLIAAAEKNATVEDVGTFGWRFNLYQKTLEELASRNPVRLLIGSGTSSGATLVLEQGIFVEDNVDPNRSIHDEFLRATYEWGFVGLFLLLLFLAHALLLGIRGAMQNRSPQAWAFLAICFPLLISLTVENFLADSGSPGGLGYLLVLTSMVTACGSLLVTTQRTVRVFRAPSNLLNSAENSSQL